MARSFFFTTHTFIPNRTMKRTPQKTLAQNEQRLTEIRQVRVYELVVGKQP